ncbi:MAG: glucosaminidase domain-containing protein [Romboutsia sp.]|uniref:glucosaminidase domain-containing protein n=1 Tax=Romboutsia sp. TaxID=1965302 RepID=UPI003F3AC45E
MKIKYNILILLLTFTVSSFNIKIYANEDTLIYDEYIMLVGETYEKVTKGSFDENSSLNYSELPKEVIDDLDASSNITYLKLKTDANYEVAIAYENGDYTYLDSASTIEEAIKKAKDAKVENRVDMIPTVINKDGLVVYATDAIGKVVKVVGNRAVDNNDVDYTSYVVPIYENENSKNEYTFINHGFIDDVPVIQDNGNRVKIQVNGITGWIDKADAKGTNIVIVPINQAKNISYYSRGDNSSLKHYISYDVKANSKGNFRNIGVAPSFMELGEKYYSYDGKYFYLYIEDLIKDLKNNTNENAINEDDPYYNYYTYIPGRYKTLYSVNEINEYIKNNVPENSVLLNKGKTIVEMQNKYGVSANLILSIAMNESNRGTSKMALEKNNIFGLGAYDNNTKAANKFNSVEECIEDFAKNWMSKEFFNPDIWKYEGSNLGNKKIGMNVRYATDPFWGEKAAGFMYEMDRYISGNNQLIEYNSRQLAIYKNIEIDENLKSSSSLEDTKLDDLDYKDGNSLIVLSKLDENIKLHPDKLNNENSTYDWSKTDSINSSNIELINKENKNVRNFKKFNLQELDNKSTEIKGTGEEGSTVKAYVDGVQIGKTITISDEEIFNINIPNQKRNTEVVVKISKEGYDSTSKSISVTGSSINIFDIFSSK